MDTMAVSRLVAFVSLFGLLATCPAHALRSKSFHIQGAAIVCGGRTVVLRGVNAMHVFGGDGADLTGWPGITIVREFVGDLKHAPLAPGGIYRDEANNRTLHSLQDIVKNNTKRGIVSLICPWSVDGTPQTSFEGVSPMTATWYSDYKARMRDWAKQFRGQQSVMIEVMNEPFEVFKTPSDDDAWLASMADMVDNLRSAGWDGVIVVPGASWGQDESVIERMGPALLKGRKDILFDVHVYERWLRDPATIGSRIAAVKNSGLAFVFGEIGPQNQGIYDPRPFLDAASKNNLSVLAWGWGTWGARSPGCLQTNEGGPYDTESNFGWGSAFKGFLASH